MPAAQFAYRKGLGCTDALQTIYHNLQNSLDTEMVSYVVQFDFTGDFDRVSHCGLSFKLKSTGVDGGVMSILTSFSPTAVCESWLIVLLVSGSKLFLAYHREVCYVLFCSSFIPLNRTEDIHMLMPPHY